MKIFKTTRKFFFSHIYYILFAIFRMRMGILLSLLPSFFGRKAGYHYLLSSKESLFQSYPSLYERTYSYFTPLRKRDFSSLLNVSVHRKDWLSKRGDYKKAILPVNGEEAVLSSFYDGLIDSFFLYRLISFLLVLGTYFLTNFLISLFLRKERRVKGGIVRFLLRRLLNSVLSTALIGFLTYLFGLFPLFGALSSLLLFLFRLYFSLFAAWILQGERKVSFKDVRRWKNASGLYGAELLLRSISVLISFTITLLFKGSYSLLLLSASFYRCADNILIYSAEGYVSLLRDNRYLRK